MLQVFSKVFCRIYLLRSIIWILSNDSFFLRTCSSQEGQFCSRAQGYFKRLQFCSLLKYSPSCQEGVRRSRVGVGIYSNVVLRTPSASLPYRHSFGELKLPSSQATLPRVAPLSQEGHFYPLPYVLRTPSPRQRVEELFAIFVL